MEAKALTHVFFLKFWGYYCSGFQVRKTEMENFVTKVVSAAWLSWDFSYNIDNIVCLLYNFKLRC